LSFRYSVLYPYPKTRLLGRSSLEVQPSFTVCTRKPRPRPLGPGQLSWDFFPLQRIQATRVHVLPVLPGGPPTRSEDQVGVRRWVPPHPLRCRSQAFSTSQRLTPLLAVLPFSDRWRSWGSPFRDFPFTKPPATHRRRITLLPLLPPVDLPRYPRPGFLWACGPPPRWFVTAPLPTSGSSSA